MRLRRHAADPRHCLTPASSPSIAWRPRAAPSRSAARLLPQGEGPAAAAAMGALGVKPPGARVQRKVVVQGSCWAWGSGGFARKWPAPPRRRRGAERKALEERPPRKTQQARIPPTFVSGRSRALLLVAEQASTRSAWTAPLRRGTVRDVRTTPLDTNLKSAGGPGSACSARGREVGCTAYCVKGHCNAVMAERNFFLGRRAAMASRLVCSTEARGSRQTHPATRC